MTKEQEQRERNQWRALIAGKESALEWLFDNLSQSLFNYGMKVLPDREVVKDCIQDLFSDLWKKRARLTVPDSPRFYLFKALKFKIVRDSARHRRKTFLHESHLAEAFESSVECLMISEQTATENRVAVRTALHKLSERQRQVLVLRYFEDMNHAQIADILNINRQSVYNLIFSALKSLKKAMSPELDPLKVMLMVVATSGLGV